MLCSVIDMIVKNKIQFLCEFKENLTNNFVLDKTGIELPLVLVKEMSRIQSFSKNYIQYNIPKNYLTE